jgi:hypothetical protein
MIKKRLLTDRSEYLFSQDQDREIRWEMLMIKKRLLTDRSENLFSQDREILWEMLKKLGWTRILLSRSQYEKHSIEISNWFHLNCKHDYRGWGRDFIFENPRDAVNFTLRWT